MIQPIQGTLWRTYEDGWFFGFLRRTIRSRLAKGLIVWMTEHRAMASKETRNAYSRLTEKQGKAP